MFYIVVRAFGDPLFLKQTYGKGYQVNMLVNDEHVEEAQHLLIQALPSSQLVVNSNSGDIMVTVPKGDLRGLPRLFTWLESSSRALSIVKEWGVSNTTLEQVFLMLCVQNTEVNFSSSAGVSENEIHLKTCPICHVFMKETVLMRTVNGQMMLLPDSVCSACSVGNAGVHYYVDEEEAVGLQSAPDRSEKISSLLSAAQTKMEAAATQRVLELEAKEHEEQFGEDDWRAGDDTAMLLPSASMEVVDVHAPTTTSSSAAAHDPNTASDFEDPYATSAHGSFGSQVCMYD